MINKPIFEKESYALLKSLHYFDHEIKSSLFTILLTDNKVSYFLFSDHIRRSVKKIDRFSIKIHWNTQI